LPRKTLALNVKIIDCKQIQVMSYIHIIAENGGWSVHSFQHHASNSNINMV